MPPSLLLIELSRRVVEGSSRRGAGYESFASRYRAKGHWARLARVLIAVLALAGSAQASLTDLLVPTRSRSAPVTFLAAPFQEELQRTISRSTDFFATATTPGFTFRLNPDLGIFERTSATLGPAFLERAETIGQGRFDIGVSFLWANFTELDGDSLEGNQETVLYEVAGGLGADAARVTYEKFDLVQRALYFSATYGVLPQLDVNILLPVFITSLDLRSRVQTNLAGSFTTEGDDSVAGQGDLQLRAKYRFYESDTLRGAAGLGLRVPSGNEDDFQGIGVVTLTPSAVFSWLLDPFEFHGSLGFELVPGDLERSRVNYALGMSGRIASWITGNLDLIGSSGLAHPEVTTFAPGVSPQSFGIADQALLAGFDLTRVPGGTDITTKLDRIDVVYIAPGFKFLIAEETSIGSIVGFASVIVPLTKQGVTPNAVPAFGIEIAFGT